MSKIFKNKWMGSGILVVVLSAVIFTVYVTSTFAEEEHFYILQDKYEKSIVQLYEKDYNNIEEYYQKQLEKQK